MKLFIKIKRIIYLAFTFLLSIIFIIPVSVSAAGDNAETIVKTGDSGILGIIIAVIAFIATAFITTKLTKRKNK